MEVAKSRNLLFLLLLIAGLFLAVWLSRRQGPGLAQLQQQTALAGTPQQREAILQKLDHYYLEHAIPDSLQQRLRERLAGSLDEEGAVIDIQQARLEENPYLLENTLNKIVHNAMLGLCRNDGETFHVNAGMGHELAQKVDRATGHPYWVPYFDRLAEFDSTKARAWLMAKHAADLCKNYSSENYELAELYGIAGLQLLRTAPDARMRLDILQRLIINLYQARGMFDLTFALLSREIPRAEDANYHLRACGLLYHHANALFLSGENARAQKIFAKTIAYAAQHADVPYMSWYTRAGKLGLAKTLWREGDFAGALAVCDELEQSGLPPDAKISLHNTRGAVYRNMGFYSKAEDEYRKVLELSAAIKDPGNYSVALNNLGYLYYSLSDYERALQYYSQAFSEATAYSRLNAEMQSKILINRAEALAALGDTEAFNRVAGEAAKLVEKIPLPATRAQFSNTVGLLNLRMQKYPQAAENFRHAIQLYEANGATGRALDARIYLARCLAGQRDFAAAEALLDQIYDLAEAGEAAQARLDVMGLRADLAYQSGDLPGATRLYNRLRAEISRQGRQTVGLVKLLLYNQRNYEYLKQAVVCELANQRPDSAFVKLDHAKAWTLAMQRQALATNGETAGHSPVFLDLDTLRRRLRPDERVLSYFLTEDTLFAFLAGDHNRLTVLRRAISSEALQHLANAYVGAIYRTIDLLQNRRPQALQAHFDSTLARAEKLRQVLLGWPALQNQLRRTKTLYLIPDEFLQAVPFATLTTAGPAGRPHKFLIEETALVTLPAAQFLGRAPERPRFDSLRVLLSVDERLNRARDLVRKIRQIFPNSAELTVPGPAVTKHAILQQLAQKYDLYILAGHSEPNGIFPDSSIFEMAAKIGDGSQQQRLRLTLAELKTVDWSSAGMVMLIGCETARGRLFRGSGMAGIQQALLTLGAREVLGSLWKIDAGESLSQIELFLQAWRRRGRSAPALQETQVKKIHEFANDAYFKAPHPFLWGGLILTRTMQTN